MKNLKIEENRLIYQILTVFICTAISLVVMSCGYTKTEDDKFPDMVEFPEHANAQIVFESTGMKIDTLYHSNTKTILAKIDVFSEANPTKKYLVEMDEKLNIIDSIRFNDEYFITKNGNIYLNRDDSWFKYTRIKSKAIKIPSHPFNASLYKDSIENYLEKNGTYALGNFPDSLQYEMSRTIDSIAYHKAEDEFEKRILKNLKCVKSFYSGYLLMYEQNEFILENGNMARPLWNRNIANRKTANKLLREFKFCEWQNKFIDDYENNLMLKDKAVTSNGSSGGNHFVPGTFYPRGYQYYDFTIDGVTTQFKHFAEHVKRQKVTSRNLPNTNTYLLDVRKESYDDNEVSTYIARLKK